MKNEAVESCEVVAIITSGKNLMHLNIECREDITTVLEFLEMEFTKKENLENKLKSSS